MKKKITLLLIGICCSGLCTAREYKVSAQGEEFIKKHESLKLKRYHCGSEKFYTIGYGHVIKKGEHYTTISKAKADKIFASDMKSINASVNRILKSLPHNDKVRYRQGLVDALGSLIYNCGESGVKNTKFYTRLYNCRYDRLHKCINKVDLAFTCYAIKTTKITYKGHVKRRLEEYKMSIS